MKKNLHIAVLCILSTFDQRDQKSRVQSWQKKPTFEKQKIIQSYLNESMHKKQTKTNQGYLSMAMGLLMVTVAFDKSARLCKFRK
jgi:hypothetical protein